MVILVIWILSPFLLMDHFVPPAERLVYFCNIYIYLKVALFDLLMHQSGLKEPWRGQPPMTCEFAVNNINFEYKKLNTLLFFSCDLYSTTSKIMYIIQLNNWSFLLQDCKAMLWDLNDGKHLHTLDHNDIITALCFSPNRYWLCAAFGAYIKIWVTLINSFKKFNFYSKKLKKMELIIQ